MWAYNMTNNTWFMRKASLPMTFYPYAYYGPAMVYDPVSSNTVIYGGYQYLPSYKTLNQTWIYNYTADHWTGPLTPNPNLGRGTAWEACL